MKEDALNYTKKVTFMRKGNVDRHLASGGHLALSNESISANKNVNGNAPIRGQISIETSLKELKKLAYKKLFEAAYNLAEGKLLFNKFKVLVKCLRDNKVKLVSAFDENNGLVNLPENTYKYCMISSTADGASVKFGKYSGLLTQQKENRPLLITIYCVAHRAELALKDSLVKYKEYKEVDDLMTSVFYLQKRSGKLKRVFKNTAAALNIDGYVFPKVTGTRFVTRRIKGAKVCRTAIADAKTKPTIQVKIQNHQKKLNDFRFCCHAVMYYKVLSVCLTLQFEFEKGSFWLLMSVICYKMQ